MKAIQEMNQYFTDIYYYLHPEQTDKITHHAIRILQQIQKEPTTTIKDLAARMNISHNTASEHVKRLIQKGYLQKKRNTNDERVVFLSLTEEGTRIIRENTELDKMKLAKLFNHLSDQDKKIILDGFHLLAEEAAKCFS